tara:strand:+ start:1139 stop:1909 length:771 start_codon:yes stop_codon:yes gene_type:complete
MDYAELAYLTEIIQLHCSPRGYQGKGTRRFPLDHEQMLMASQQIFLFFPKEIPSGSRNRRILIDQRIRDVVNQYSDEEFQTLGDMIETVFINWQKAKKSKKAKYKIDTVRERHPTIYNEILQAQQQRCVFCGYQFEEDEMDSHLDHILPYNLGGDCQDGSNWQILCRDCNEGKGSLFTVLQHRGRHDWIYHLKRWYPEAEDRENWRRFRLFVLIRDGRCNDCERGPDQVQLHSVNLTSGLSISSNMTCLCENCRHD